MIMHSETVTPDPGALRPMLLSCHEHGFSGVLVSTGRPTGTICLRNGRVAAAATSVAPNPESLLLRSGRIREPDWVQAYATGAASGRLAGELVRAGVIGEAELEVVCLTAVFDAVFALALSGAGVVPGEPVHPTDPLLLLPCLPGVDPGWLVRETDRRMAVAARWDEVEVTVRTRVTATPAAGDARLDEARRRIAARANGRRTPRDIAFTLGRGLYAVTAEIAEMVRDGLLAVVGPGTPAPPAPERGGLPRHRPGSARVRDVPQDSSQPDRLPSSDDWASTDPADRGSTATASEPAVAQLRRLQRGGRAVLEGWDR